MLNADNLCSEGVDRSFSTILSDGALIDFDRGREMNQDEYKKTAEYREYEKKFIDANYTVDKEKMLRGYEIQLNHIQDGTMMLGHKGFPLLLKRQGTKVSKLTFDSLKSTKESDIKVALSSDFDGPSSFEDGFWAMKTSNGNFVSVEIRGLSPKDDYPFKSPDQANVRISACVYEAGWF